MAWIDAAAIWLLVLPFGSLSSKEKGTDKKDTKGKRGREESLTSLVFVR